MKTKRSFNDRFIDIADKVSYAMGLPLNSGIWFALIIAWTIFCFVRLGWGFFTDSYYNFPLNLVTTVAELFIGFLLAAAANRAQRKLELILDKLLRHEKAIEILEKNSKQLIEENTTLTKEVHTLVQEIHKITIKTKNN